MISADTSTWIAFLQGERGDDTDLLDRALADKLVVMAPVVLTELLSDPKLEASIGRTLSGLPLLELRTVSTGRFPIHLSAKRYPAGRSQPNSRCLVEGTESLFRMARGMENV